MSVFQIIILSVFGVFAVGGLLIFAGVGGFSDSSGDIGTVLIWGTLSGQSFNSVLATLAEDNDGLRNVAYVQKDSRTYNSELTEALASGGGPDLFLLEDSYIVRHKDKVVPIPYENLPQQQFQSTFVSSADVYLDQSGVLGVPISVDPLVLYYNEDMLTKNGFVSPPVYWDELFDMAEKVTERDDANNIKKSAVAFGEFVNVVHAKDVLTALIMQAGGTVAARDESGRLRGTLGSQLGEVAQPTQSALRFYTEFANPSKIVYSWNRSLPGSRDAFTSGDLALYVGYASELPLLRSLNPNISIKPAPLPQIRGADRSVTLGSLQAFAIPRTTQNIQGALSVAFILSGKSASAQLAEARGTPSPRRDLLAEAKDGPDAVFRSMAIISRSWLDPNPEKTAEIFRGMIESVTSGSAKLSEAVQQADKELNNLLGL